MGDPQLPEMAGRVTSPAAQEMSGSSAEADHDPGMLQPAVAVEEPCSHRTHLRPTGLTDHGVEPARFEHGHIVVEQHHDPVVGLCNPGIDHGGEIEGVRERDDPHARVGAQGLVMGEHARIGGAVVDENRGGLVPRQGLQHLVAAVVRGDDDGDPRLVPREGSAALRGSRRDGPAARAGG